MNTGLDQYMDIFKDAVEDSAAKLTKSFEKILIEVIILFMVILLFFPIGPPFHFFPLPQ